MGDGENGSSIQNFSLVIDELSFKFTMYIHTHTAAGVGVY